MPSWLPFQCSRVAGWGGRRLPHKERQGPSQLRRVLKPGPAAMAFGRAARGAARLGAHRLGVPSVSQTRTFAEDRAHRTYAPGKQAIGQEKCTA